MLRRFRHKKFHISYGISVISFGLLVGISLSQSITGSRVSYVIIYFLFVLLGLLCIRIRLLSFIPVLIISTTIGYIHGTNVVISLKKLEPFAGQQIVVTGVISEDPQKTVRGDMRIILADISIDNKSYDGTIWMTTKEGEFKRGDRLTIKDTMKTGFGTHQLSATYVTILQHNKTNDPLIAMRDHFAANLREVVVEPAASLGIGFVIGQKSALPPDLEDQLRIVGLTHLIVASGYNLTILMRFAKRLFEKHSKFLVIASSIALVVTFIAISGASPSMVRAGLVAGLSIAAWSYGRRFHPIHLILFVAAITATANPVYLWADIGWWLSFLAFFGVLVVSPLLLRIVNKKRDASAITQLVTETIAAQIVTLPLLLFVFGSLPLLSLFANILTAPLVPLAMLMTVIAGVANSVFPLVAPVLAIPAEVLLSYIIAVVKWLSSPAWAIQEVAINTFVMVSVYVTYLFIVGIVWYKTKYDFRSQSIID